MIPYHERGVQERGHKRADEHYAKAKNPHVAKASEVNRSADEVMCQTCADHCFTRIADEPAQNHQRWNVTLELRRQMRRKRGQQHKPPDAWWRQQKRRNQDRIRRPKNGNRMRLKRERKPDFATDVISSEYPQPDEQQPPVENRTESVPVPRY